MASINGVSLKKVHYYVGHEGGCFQGDVYIDGKKQGFWTQDSWGGPDEFQFDTKELSKRAREYYKKNPMEDFMKLYSMEQDQVDFNNIPTMDVENMPEPESMLLEELVELKNIEKNYKKWAKNGYTKIIAQLKCVYGRWPIPAEDRSYAGVTTRKQGEEYFKKFTSKFPYAKVIFYEGLDSFVK